jgi:Ca2+-binding RTX toxin-like protein
MFLDHSRRFAHSRTAVRKLNLERLDDRITPSLTATIDPVLTTSPEGTLLSFTGVVDGAAGPVTYAWSVTKDGVDYAAGAAADFSFTPDDNAAFAVTLSVSDGVETAGANETVVVTNVAPTASITGPTLAVRSQSLSFTLSASDPSTVDAAAGFTFNIDWNGDGTTDQTVSGPSGTVVTHSFSTEGTFNVTVTATDKDGGVSDPATLAVEIKAAAVMDDPLNPGHKLLAIGGTDGNDRIHTVQLGRTFQLKVFINGKLVGTFEPVERIAVYAGAGNDNVTLANNIIVPIWEYGGDGNDRLQGAKGNDVLLGEAGNDFLDGHQGNDLEIGGIGADRILGGPGDDLLIAGTTSFDKDDAALFDIIQRWGSSDTYANRVANLRTGEHALTTSGDNATVQQDADKDMLTGASGKDWFFADPVLDKITGNIKGLAINDADVPGGGK